MRFEKDFKEALAQLPSKEKDRLILRLLKHDLALADKLMYELLETKSVLERRDEMAERIKNRVTQMVRHYYSPGVLLMDLRELSGEINEHVQITSDKVGEPMLHVMMLSGVLTGLGDKIARAQATKSHTFCIYVVARVFRTLVQIKSLDEDWLIEFREPLHILGEQICNNSVLMQVAISNGLDINWLLNLELTPENIAEILKNIRAQGLLK